MEKKNSTLTMLMLVIAVCLVVSILRPQPQRDIQIAGSLHTDVSGITPQSMIMSNQPNDNAVASSEQMVALGDNRFAVIDGNPNSDTHGLIMIYEYDVKSGKLKFLTSDSYVARMHQRTE